MFEIKNKSFPHIAKTFTDLRIRRKQAAKVIIQIENNKYEDLSIATKIDLKQVLIKYRNEITAKKKGSKKHSSKLNVLINHKIALNTAKKNDSFSLSGADRKN